MAPTQEPLVKPDSDEADDGNPNDTGGNGMEEVSDMSAEEGDEEMDSDAEEDSDASDNDSGADMDSTEAEGAEEDSADDSETEENEGTSAALQVALPDELAELAAGRDDNVDDDDVVQAILQAREKHKTHPPTITCEDGVSSLSFHPYEELIAVGTYTGDIHLYKYSNDANDLKSTNELHMKAVRDVEFSIDGKTLLSCSKDKSILITDVETEKLTNMWDGAHSSAISTLYVVDENRFCSGCEDGFVKLWDKRQKEAVFSMRVMEDVVNKIISTSQKRHIAVACGGTITCININSRKMQVQSEDYDHDLTCMGLVRQETKLVVGSSKGTAYLFQWGEFGLHSDEFTAFKQPMTCLLPVTETVVITGWEDGKLRANHMFPHQPLGVVGQHDVSVESLDICNDGTFIASAGAAGEHIKFWNIKYIEEVEVACRKRRKRKDEHNFPSSGVANAGDFFADLAGSS